MKANESNLGCARETFCVAWQFIDWHNKVRGKVRSLQRRIVKARRLEPYAVIVACTVLRRGRASNGSLLSDSPEKNRVHPVRILADTIDTGILCKITRNKKTTHIPDDP